MYKRLGGKEIHIVTADVPGSAEVDAVHPNTIHRLRLKRSPWLKPESLVMYLRFLLKSLRLALTNRFDAIHAFRVLPEGLVAWLVARLTNRPVIVYAHGEELTSWGHGSKYKVMCFVFRHVDRIIANSENTRDTLLKMGLDQNKITIIYPGVDVSVFRPGLDVTGLRESLGIALEDKVIFSVGRLSRRKGFDQVIRAMAQLRAENLPVHYVIAGIGEDAEYLDKLITELNLQNVVHRLGAVAAEDLPRWMNACDVFAMPNREINGDNEGFGMVFIEASACGKPVVSGIAGGTGSAVKDRITGFRVDGDMLIEVTLALHSILNDITLTTCLGEAGLKRVLAELTWERVAEKTQQTMASYD